MKPVSKKKKSLTPTALLGFILLSSLTKACTFTTFTNKKCIKTYLCLSWKIEGSTIRMQYEKSQQGHAFLGFGTSMTGSDAILFMKTNGGNGVTVSDMHLVARRNPVADTTNDITVVCSTATPTSFKVEFTRPMIVSGNEDKTLVNGVNDILWSFTDSDSPQQHTGSFGDKYGTMKIDFSKANGESELTIAPEGNDWWGDGFMLHEHLLLILWTIVADALIIVGKYMKFFSRWFDVHAWALLAMFILNRIAVFNHPDGEGDDRRVLVSMYSHQFTQAKNERILVEALADGDLHGNFAAISGPSFIFLVLGGLLLRFAIALEKRRWLHFVSSFDLSKQRIVHTVIGILGWFGAKMACLTG